MFVACVLSLYIIQYILCWRVFLFSFIGFSLLFPKEKKMKRKAHRSLLVSFRLRQKSLCLFHQFIYTYCWKNYIRVYVMSLLDRLQTTCLLLFILFLFDFCQSFVLILSCKINCCNNFHKNISQSAYIRQQQMTISCVFCNEMWYI